jgi:uncharacterized protein (DUF302 family)
MVNAPESPAPGVVDRRSRHSVEETLARFEAVLRAKGITLFTVIDHSGEAAKVGLTMPRTRLLVFGKPAAGTPLMLAARRLAIDLPLKALIWEDLEGAVWVSTNSAEYLRDRYGLRSEHLPALAVVDALATAAAE